MIRPEDPDAEVRRLLQQPRPTAVDSARAARVRPAVHAAWKEAAGSSRRNWQRGLALAAAAVLVAAIALTLVNTLLERATPQEATPIASALFVTTDVTFELDGQSHAGRVGEDLKPGTRISTHSGRASIVLKNGVELRLDSNTDIRLDAALSMTLASGAVYLDSSHRTGSPEAVAITAHGTVVRDIGTRYEVRLSGEELRVRVRDGRVELTGAFGTREADRGGQLRVTPAGVLAGKAPTSGTDWDWIVKATRQPQLEGRPLPEFLAWAEGEGGRPIRFADPALERANATTIVYGAIEGLTVDEALDVVLPSCGLASQTDGEVITIVAADDAAGAGKSR